ncbi:MAG TPA: hypothetical protein VMM15_20925 [Bradyrhizobium sp.]|nr:hypothetical protein [Bradyrhizobium sp.]
MIWNAFWIVIAAVIGSFTTWVVLRSAQANQKRDYAGLRHHAKVHTFRLSTVLIAWAVLIIAFVFYPKYIAQSLRVFSHAVEDVADVLPDQIGSYVEIGLRELGGLFWFQITALVIVVRVILSCIAAVWRIGRRNP